MERLGRHYERILEALAGQPRSAVGDVALSGPGEAAQIAAWSAGPAAYASGELVHRLFEARARSQPEATALLFANQSWSYARLEEQANRLAHHLIALGVRPEARVGIAMERSCEMVLALLATMKAGGAYVPLDPEHHADRLRHMAEDSGIQLLLTQSHLSGRLQGLPALRALELDTLDLAAWPAHAPQVPLHGENLVYLIYTSGSTGRPKGVGNCHRALCNRLAWGQQHQPLSPGDTVLQKTPFGFDISFWEFFWPLSAGARLALAGPGEHRDPARIAALVERHRVDTIHFVPSMLQAFLSSGQAASCDSLRRIICSGEALSAELAGRALALLPRASLLNLYGPTEAAIEVTWHDCRGDGRASVPIGRPLGRVAVQVVDADLNPVPQGVAGELLLGGLALARGYWARPGLTAERFIASPDAALGERAYRTGDLVRWNRDGELEYLGRLDHQVKIRGFRIELGEIEAALLAEAGVREAVVVAVENAGDTRLVAYYAAADRETGQGDGSAALKARLGRVLPDYMVPALLVCLERLPLNGNGKVDRMALPAPAFAATAAFVAPSGPLAETLAGIWRELLGLEQVGLHDNFFDIGGHSLLLIRMHRLLEDRLATGLSVMDMFQHPSIASLVQRIGQGAVPPQAAEHGQAEQRAQRRRAALLGRRGAAGETV
jgi:amino acid adenylation domain-containing protein